MDNKKIKSALISVFYKEHLEPIIKALHQQGITIYSTGGTQQFIENLGVPVVPVENLTSYPSILDGRVKTLHPKIFGGILAIRNEDHLGQLQHYDIPEIDLVIVDLYPFEETVNKTQNESEIIEKIDIGGISLIRAAAKNFNDVVIVASKNDYGFLQDILEQQNGVSTLSDRRELARRAFQVSSHYDTAIFNYFCQDTESELFKHSIIQSQPLRYGENPHQKGVYFGDLDAVFEKLAGKELSYNNLLDIDAAIGLMADFKDAEPTFAILKHNNSCGVATRSSTFQAWQDALACDTISAFGGILISNSTIDSATAEAINTLFYEVLLAPDFEEDALQLLKSKKQRVLLKVKSWKRQAKSFRSLLNGVIQQDSDSQTESKEDLKVVTQKVPSTDQIQDLLFAAKCVKHLKSNGIALVKNQQLVGMGCGQTSRVDALEHAIKKATAFGLSLEGAVMASDAFFPFPDCVEIADKAGIEAVIHPGGSLKDQDSIDYCDQHNMTMVMTGFRHFRH